MSKYLAAVLPHVDYVEDRDLWQTAYREVQEEAGLDIQELDVNAHYRVSKSLYGEIDVPKFYVSIRLVHIVGSEAPVLAKIVGDEVVAAEWVPLDNFDLTNKQVATTVGKFIIKPFVSQSTERLVNELRATPEVELIKASFKS